MTEDCILYTINLMFCLCVLIVNELLYYYGFDGIDRT